MERGLKKVKMAGGPGFEPGLTESESVVLPLNDPPNQLSNYQFHAKVLRAKLLRGNQLSIINDQLSAIINIICMVTCWYIQLKR